MNYLIVTGASRGLGAALVEEALQDGWQVIAVSRSRNSGIITTSEGSPGSLTWIVADLSDPQAVADGHAELTGKIDAAIDRSDTTSIALINNAATLEPVGLTGSASMDLSGLSTAVSLNITGPIMLTNWFVQTFGPVSALPPEAFRTVINISSGASRRVMPGLATYSASKAAINAFTASAAAELTHLVESGEYAPVGICAVSPGLVDTGMQETLRSSDTDKLPGRDTYATWHEEGKLKSTGQTAHQILALIGRTDLQNGEFLHIDKIEEEQ